MTTINQIIAAVKAKANGRTTYPGQEPFWDEVLVGEIERLRRALRLACTPPFKTGGTPGACDETLVAFFLRRSDAETSGT